jgi:hypothetical protein
MTLVIPAIGGSPVASVNALYGPLWNGHGRKDELGMNLWSKGLGRLVLSLRLSECGDVEVEEEALVLRGTMGEPVYWSYAVRMRESDVLDFLELLEQPAAVRFMSTGERRWALLRTALGAAVAFAWNFGCRLIGRSAASRGAGPEGNR